MISGNVPKHLVSGARTGFLVAMRSISLPWQKVAMVHNMDGKTTDLVDLGASPMPVKSIGGLQSQDFIEKTMEVRPEDWEIVVWISQNAIDDDRTGDLQRKVKGAGTNFQRHINKRVFQVLNAGDSQTYGACYDSQDFFDSDHADAGAAYQTSQDNENALTLSIDNFETVFVAAQAFKNDQGENVEYQYDLLVINPANERVAVQICKNENSYDTGNREKNPYAGEITYIKSAELDSTAWHLIASNEGIKPIIVAMRKQPQLQDAWFDPVAADGGRHYFKFFARYEMYYGDWRLASQGNT